jgi:hypothetical protein
MGRRNVKAPSDLSYYYIDAFCVFYEDDMLPFQRYINTTLGHIS